jgi:hypothetical protein
MWSTETSKFQVGARKRALEKVKKSTDEKSSKVQHGRCRESPESLERAAHDVENFRRR